MTGIVGRADVLTCILSLLAFIAYHSNIEEQRLTIHWLKVCILIQWIHVYVRKLAL